MVIKKAEKLAIKSVADAEIRELRETIEEYKYLEHIHAILLSE